MHVHRSVLQMTALPIRLDVFVVYPQIASAFHHDPCEATVRTHRSFDGLSVTVFQLLLGSCKVVSGEMLNLLILCVLA